MNEDAEVGSRASEYSFTTNSRKAAMKTKTTPACCFQVGSLTRRERLGPVCVYFRASPYQGGAAPLWIPQPPSGRAGNPGPGFRCLSHKHSPSLLSDAARWEVPGKT